ncbi:MAG: ABC transporter ATP-binding protein [Planctomycetes bacterium]|nr:ABC transporter ATP-binding protein [Planctomycetota bacterium]
MQASLIRARELRKLYRKGLFGGEGFPALDGVSLEVGRGSVFGLLGPNGAGKTTMVKIFLGLVHRTHGEVEILGQSCEDASVRRRIGYLPEAHRLPGYLTGRQMLRLFAQMSGCAKSEIDDRIEKQLELVGMRDAAGRKISEYSKGMQQRIGLAQALIHEPELVFLDEPTDGVDPVGRMAIREIVLRLKNKGVTLFLNSHLLMEVEMICDRVVILSRGKILREGTMAELTPRTGSVRFELKQVPADLASLLAGIGSALVPQPGGFELALNDDAELDRCIDRLRSAGVSIRAVQPRKLSLEEAFVGMLKDQGGPR